MYNFNGLEQKAVQISIIIEIENLQVDFKKLTIQNGLYDQQNCNLAFKIMTLKPFKA